MHYQRTFTSRLSCDICKRRTLRLLEYYGFRLLSEGSMLEFERSVPGAGLAAVQPRTVHAKVAVWLAQEKEGCSVLVTEVLQRYGQPSSALDKALWEGELDDLQALLVEDRDPTQDRRKQNEDAGRLSLIVLVAAAIIGAGLLLSNFSLKMPVVQVLTAYAVPVVAMVLVYSLYPFRLPDRPLSGNGSFR